MFSAETYINRRLQLKRKVGKGLILLLGNDESPMNYTDNTYHFRQDSSFLYYFGIDIPGLTAILDIDEQKDCIFGDDFTIDDIVWRGIQPTIKELARKAGVENTASLSSVSEILKKGKAQNRTIHFLPAYRAENSMKLMKLLSISADDLKISFSAELAKAIVDMRIFKSEEEIEEIHKAATVSAEMHLTALRMIKPGITEAVIMAAMTDVALASGGNNAFPPIVTINGQILHNHHYGNILREGDLLLLDAGAESVRHYAGDLSSTFPVSGKFTERQKEIYEVSLEAHQFAVSQLKPGINFRNIHLSTCKLIAERMKDLGFMKGNIDDAVNEGAHAMFFPCGLGHMLGLDVHDMEDLGEIYVGYEGKSTRSKQFGLKSLRLARELQAGFTLTIEPGIYFIPELIDKWRNEKRFIEFLNYEKLETYKNFGGVRNEENYLITETGATLLGKELPKTIEKIEAM